MCSRRFRFGPHGGRVCHLAPVAIALITLALLPSAYASKIVPSGTTATSVSTEANGHANIGLATPHTGVSYNAFSTFDVDVAGATMRNEGVNARTIVAEVFSTAPATIDGVLALDGPRANLIFANQNGISVNGGEFANFGSVALTTGAVRLEDVALSTELTQRYVRVDTAGGNIDIGPAGLAAELIHLELIAGSIRTSGSITNRYTSPTAVTRVIAGKSSALFDTAVSPSDNLTPWLHFTGGGSTTNGVYALDITAGAKVTSGRIEVHITDRGAGVRNAGEFLASVGDFTLTSNGVLEQVGGTIEALGDVHIQSASLAQSSLDGRDSRIAASGSVTIRAEGDIRNVGGLIVGNVRGVGDDVAAAAVFLKADGDIENRTEVGGNGAIVFGSADNVILEAGGDILNVNARMLSNESLVVRAGGVARNESLHLAPAVAGRESHRRDSLAGLKRERRYSMHRGTLADPEHRAYWVAEGNLTVEARNVENIGGHILANQGDVRLSAIDNVLNKAHAIGELRYSRSCTLFICKRKAASSEQLIGGEISAGNDLHIAAGMLIDNDAGFIQSIRDMELDAPMTRATGTPIHTVLRRAEGLKAFFGDTWAELYAIDQGGTYTAQQGRLILAGQGIQDRGVFSARDGVEGSITEIQAPQRDSVRIDNHLGIISW